MTVSNQNPVADSLLTPADSVSFDLTPNGALTFFQVTVLGDATEVAISSSTFQAGYEGTQTILGGVRSVEFRRTAGWDSSPFTVKVDWVDDGGSQSESWSFTLANESLYPDLMQPRNPAAVGTLILTDNGVKVRTDVGWIDLVGFTVENLGNGKVRITDSGGVGVSDLDSVINALIPDNNVTLNDGERIILVGDSIGSAVPVLDVRKTLDSTTPVLKVYTADTGKGLEVDSPSTLGMTLEPGGVKPKTLGTNFVFGNRDGIAGIASGGFNIFAGQKHTDGGSKGGNVSIQGGIGGAEDGDIQVGVDNTEELILSATTAVKVDLGLKLKERAAADADTPGYGQLWAKDDGTIWFTNDAGTDIQIGVGGTAAAVASYGTWTYDTTTTGAGILNGDFRLNNADPTAATELYVAKTNKQGVNVGGILDELGGWRLSLLNKDSDEALYVLVASPVDNSTYFTYTISQNVGDASFTDGETMTLSPLPSVTAGGVDHVDTIYVGKHGNDSNAGTTPDKALLTIGAAMTAAAALTPAETNHISVQVVDSGVYSEQVTVPEFVSLHAPEAEITTATLGYALTLDGSTNTVVRTVRSTGSATGCVQVDVGATSGTARIDAQEVLIEAGTFGFANLNASGVILMLNAHQIRAEGTSSIAVGDLTSGIGHIHATVEDIYLAGNSSFGIVRVGTGSSVFDVGHILEIGGATTTTALYVATGTLSGNVRIISADTAWNVVSGTLNLFVNESSGTETEVGTANVTKAGAGGVGGGMKSFQASRNVGILLDTWSSWQSSTIDIDSTWNTGFGADTSDPVWTNSGDIGILVPKAGSLTSVKVVFRQGFAGSVPFEVELWGDVFSDGDGSFSPTLRASGTKTLNSLGALHILDLTIDSATLAANTMLKLFFRRTDGGAAITAVPFVLDIDWSET